MKMRKLDQILEQCLEEADFTEADLSLEKLSKLCDEALVEEEINEEENIDNEIEY